MSALRTGAVGDSRFKKMMQQETISVDRSGGGVWEISLSFRYTWLSRFLTAFLQEVY